MISNSFGSCLNLNFSASAAAFYFPWSKMKINIEEIKRVQKQKMAVNGWTGAIVKSTCAILATGFLRLGNVWFKAAIFRMLKLKLPFFPVCMGGLQYALCNGHPEGDWHCGCVEQYCHVLCRQDPGIFPEPKLFAAVNLSNLVQMMYSTINTDLENTSSVSNEIELKFTSDIQRCALRSHVVIGEAGVGKTTLVLQTLRQFKVVYGAKGVVYFLVLTVDHAGSTIAGLCKVLGFHRQSHNINRRNWK
jgi:hypothetical protein